MENIDLAAILSKWAEEYNQPKYFQEDPIIFPKHFASLLERGICTLADVEIAAIFSAHLAWGRRSMIVRDCNRLFEEMEWKPLNYVMRAKYKADNQSIHRTIKWSDIAKICERLRQYFSCNNSLESLSVDQIRREIYGQKEDKWAANKKINMLRRWFVRDDKKVDMGLWTSSSKEELIIPLDVHVYNIAFELGLTKRKSKDLRTAIEITENLKKIFPQDPCLGDFALFGYGLHRKKLEND